MATATTTVKDWESPERTRVSGEPPGPDVTVSHVGRGETRKQDIRAVHPLYKSGTVPGVPSATGVGVHITQESRVEPTYYDVPDYKVEKERESYHLRIIDPKVEPTKYRTMPTARSKTPDFPSTHSKRSFLKLSALEPRRSRTTKIITPNDYLTQSLERHQRLYMSPLRENLQLDEKDVIQPWNAADRPGPQKRSPLLDLTSTKNIRAQESATSVAWQFSPRSVVDVNVPKKPSPEPLKIRTDFKPAAPAAPLFVPVTYELTEKHESNVQYERKGRREPDWNKLSDKRGGTVIKVKDENIHKPTRSIMKQQRLMKDYEEIDRSTRAAKPYHPIVEPKKLVETTDTIEETKRVEEVERRFTSSGDKRRTRGRVRGGPDGGRRATHRSGYTKSHSSKEFYGPDDEFRRMNIAGSQSGPIVEFPPTLPRSETSYSDRQTVKRGLRRDYDVDERQSRSRRDWALQPHTYDDSWALDRNYDGVTKLEREFRETSLAPLPTEQNVNKHDFREERLPHGHETLEHQIKAESGSRGPNNRFSEAKQLVQYKREQVFDA